MALDNELNIGSKVVLDRVPKYLEAYKNMRGTVVDIDDTENGVEVRLDANDVVLICRKYMLKSAY